MYWGSWDQRNPLLITFEFYTKVVQNHLWICVACTYETRPLSGIAALLEDVKMLHVSSTEYMKHSGPYSFTYLYVNKIKEMTEWLLMQSYVIRFHKRKHLVLFQFMHIYSPGGLLEFQPHLQMSLKFIMPGVPSQPESTAKCMRLTSAWEARKYECLFMYSCRISSLTCIACAHSVTLWSQHHHLVLVGQVAPGPHLFDHQVPQIGLGLQIGLESLLSAMNSQLQTGDSQEQEGGRRHLHLL